MECHDLSKLVALRIKRKSAAEISNALGIFNVRHVIFYNLHWCLFILTFFATCTPCRSSPTRAYQSLLQAQIRSAVPAYSTLGTSERLSVPQEASNAP
jgi:hypothetical protein